MAAMSRGQAQRPVKASRVKKATKTTKQHRYESFSTRISKLKIEPVRRARRYHFDDADLSVTTSHFKSSLDEWRDRNLSEHFVNFLAEVEPLCDSLPQILHHEDRITDLLATYIEGGSSVSLEPLLNLVAEFAHDLGERFEKHFERILKAVSQLAARSPDIEVVEWSFNCLAWLFKYLSRLLVPDLRNLFGVMAPLLGQEKQKYFVTRFAAEAFSSLLTKAARTYYSDKRPLEVIVRHILEDVNQRQEEKTLLQYEEGLMTLFVESIKGVQNGIHSSGALIFRQLLRQTLDLLSPDHETFRTLPAEDVLTGVLIALIHHTTAESFGSLLDVVVEEFNLKDGDWPECRLAMCTRLLLVISATRRGSRVAKWELVFEKIRGLIDALNGRDVLPDKRLIAYVLHNLAVALQNSPLDSATPNIRLLETLYNAGQKTASLQNKGNIWEDHFLAFCNLFAELGPERFKAFVLPHLQRFITSHWAAHGDRLCVLLSRWKRNGVISESSFNCPEPWQSAIVANFAALREDSEGLETLTYRCNLYLTLLSITRIQDAHKHGVALNLSKFLASIPPSIHLDGAKELFAYGRGLEFLVKAAPKDAELPSWKSLCATSEKFGPNVTLEPFWTSVHEFIKQHAQAVDLKAPEVDILKKQLRSCLSSPSHELRLAALDVLSVILKGDSSIDALNSAAIIEQTPISVENARLISVRIRQLGPIYKSIASHEWLSWAIPAYCFGVLHFNLSQAWTDSINAIKEIVSTREGENIVTELAFSWLDQPTTSELESKQSEEATQKTMRTSNDFECSNLLEVFDLIEQSSSLVEDPESVLQSQFESEHSLLELSNAACRSQALRVLAGVPALAEKKSRSLVPILLQWASDSSQSPSPEDEDVATEQASPDHSALGGWNRKDQKAMLSIFAQFVNPRVLYKSQDVYDALLRLLGNGDIEIQKSALKAILTWKNPSINRYEENLSNILDDAKFREQIAVFLDVGHTDSDIQDDDRKDLIPVVLHMLYGRVISRSGAGSGKRGQESKRKAVFGALTRFGDENINQFLEIALGRLSGIKIIEGENLSEKTLKQDLMDPRKQYGLLNLLEDMIDTLKSQIFPVTSRLVDPLLFCLISAARKVASVTEHAEESNENSQASLLRKIRQTGLHCLNLLFQYCPTFSWAPYMSTIRQELIFPRLDKLPIETAQSVSGLLVMISKWASSVHLARFIEMPGSPQSVLDKTAECLSVPSAKDDVKVFVLNNILRALVETSSTEDAKTSEEVSFVKSNVLTPHANAFISHLKDILKGGPSKTLLDVAVVAVVDLAPFVSGSKDAFALLDVATYLLQQPSRRVSPKMKSNLLRIFREFIPKFDAKETEHVAREAFPVVCSLFSFFNDRDNRILLAEVFRRLTAHKPELSEVSDLCEDLNSYSTSRLDEPDFDRRSKAYALINETRYPYLDIEQWQPLVHNMLFFIKDNEELGIRVSSSFGLRRFIEAGSLKPADEQAPFQELILSAVLPGIKSGIKESSELVRIEFLSVLAQIIRKFPDWEPVKDMHVLLAGDDDEASFFTNVLHIQQHRRLRALRRLATESKAGGLRPSNVLQIFIPLLEPFIFDRADDESAHNLTSESVITIGQLVESLEWTQYRPLISRYISYMKSKPEIEKTVIRLLGSAIDGLSRAGISKGYIVEGSTVEGSADTAVDVDAMEVDAPLSKLATSMPKQNDLASDLIRNVIPSLTDYIHHKDETTVSLRIPVAVALVKILRLLPKDEFIARLPGALMDVCAILRSRSQDARDMTRKTLAEIAALIGPAYFRFILKELRTALPRGYQLHVLSFTVHSILLSLIPSISPGALDYCASDIVNVINDDIFGAAGQEKDAEDYISKMKEVKSNKSYDSMELLAKITSVTHLFRLVRPIDALLREKIDLKTLKKVDELLRRVGLGISQNSSVQDRNILIFCYEIVKEATADSTSTEQKPKDDYRVRRYIVSLKSRDKSGLKGATTSHAYKMTAFALDLVRSVLKRHEELQTPENLASFLDIIGDSLVSGHDEVQMAAVKLLSKIIRVPLPKIDKNGPEYISIACDIIESAPSTNTELAQAAIKLISSILQERHSMNIEELRENRLGDLLKRVKPDLEEPDRQGVTFNFLKAILSRKIIIAEVYEIADTVATVMVTNHTAAIRDHARSVYVKFLLEYPQKKGRFSKQMEFLVSNLTYKHEEGRKSVMETLSLVFNKVGESLLQEVLTTSFSPLALIMANDESQDCREMAAALICKVFEKADADTSKTLLALVKKWMEAIGKPSVRCLGFRCWSLYYQADPSTDDLQYFMDAFRSLLESYTNGQNEEEWELLFHSLQTFAKVCQSSPEDAFDASTESIWERICSCVTYPHAWIKTSAAKLLGLYFADFARTNAENGLQSVPLVGSGGLKLHKDRMCQLTRASLMVLKRQDIREELATQTIRNLAFLARCFAANQIEWEFGKGKTQDDDAEADDGALSDASVDAGAAEDQEDAEEEWGGFDDNKEATAATRKVKETTGPKTALHRLLLTLSAILRKPLPPPSGPHQPPSMHAKTAAMTLVLSLLNSLPADILTPSLSPLMHPLVMLTDPAYPHPSYPFSSSFTKAYKMYTDAAAEALNVLQKKIGTTEFMMVNGEVKKKIMRKREERGTKRKLDRVRDPEQYARGKRKARENLKEKRKQRIVEMKGKRRGW